MFCAIGESGITEVRASSAEESWSAFLSLGSDAPKAAASIAATDEDALGPPLILIPLEKPLGDGGADCEFKAAKWLLPDASFFDKFENLLLLADPIILGSRSISADRFLAEFVN